MAVSGDKVERNMVNSRVMATARIRAINSHTTKAVRAVGSSHVLALRLLPMPPTMILEV